MDVYGHLLPGLGDKLDAALDEAHGEATAAFSRDKHPRRNISSVATELPTCANVGGRYWDRTSDLCRVKAALSR